MVVALESLLELHNQPIFFFFYFVLFLEMGGLEIERFWGMLRIVEFGIWQFLVFFMVVECFLICRGCGGVF